MTGEQRAEIERLASIAHDKATELRYRAMSNTPSEPEEARRSSIAYALATAEAREAEGQLEALIRSLASPS